MKKKIDKTIRELQKVNNQIREYNASNYYCDSYAYKLDKKQNELRKQLSIFMKKYNVLFLK